MKTTVLWSLTALVLAAPYSANAQPCVPATFTVNSTLDASDNNVGNGVCAAAANVCTLRGAVEEANTRACLTTILFDIPGLASHTISIDSNLPTITSQVAIDGYSQPGTVANDAGLLRPGNAQLAIELRGTGSATFGLAFACPDGEAQPHIVSGLVLNNFEISGIINQGCDGAKFLGNYIGVTPSGAELGSSDQAYGIAILNAEDNWIGTANSANRNVIAGSSIADVTILGTETSSDFLSIRNRIINNFIGTNAAGDRGIDGSFPIGGTGVVILGAGTSPPSPSLTPLDPNGNWVVGNVIAGHASAGVYLAGSEVDGEPMPSSSSSIQQNIIGHGTQAFDFLTNVLADATTPPPVEEPSLRNLEEAIRVGDEVSELGSNLNTIANNALVYSSVGVDIRSGISNTASNNIVFGNEGDGVHALQANVFAQNRIWNNGALGISMELEDADGLPWITLESIVNNTIEGTAHFPVTIPSPYRCGSIRIELFANEVCDPSGEGEGRELVGSMSFDDCRDMFFVSPGASSFSGPIFAATATWNLALDFGGGSVELPYLTSHFSNCIANEAPIVNPIPDQSVEAGTSFVLSVPPSSIQDPNGDSLTLESTLSDGSPLPGWLAFDPATIRYSGLPTLSDVGQWQVRLTATDVGGLSGSATFHIDVTEPPVEVLTCDVDEDGDIDLLDIRAILAARNSASTGPGDPRDADGDGVITVLDARSCTIQCSEERCTVR